MPGYDDVVKALTDDDSKRVDFLRACLGKLGLEAHLDSPVTPPLSVLHLSSVSASSFAQFLTALSNIFSKTPDGEYLEDVNDIFKLERPSLATDRSIDRSLTAIGRFGNHESSVKTLIVHDTLPPPIEITPSFSHQSFYAYLRQYNRGKEPDEHTFGLYLLYGEVVMSTNTLLEKYLSSQDDHVLCTKRR